MGNMVTQRKGGLRMQDELQSRGAHLFREFAFALPDRRRRFPVLTHADDRYLCT